MHLGRVLAVGRDRRTTRPSDIQHDDVVVQIQTLASVPLGNLPAAVHDALPNELFIIEDAYHFVKETAIEFSTDRIVVHYGFGSAVQPSNTPSEPHRYFIRRIVTRTSTRPVSQCHPIRAELEL